MRLISRDNFPHLLRCGCQVYREKVDRAYAEWVAKWWGVELAPNCSFCGIPKFRRAPNSSITIAEGCRFLSLFASNLHGINRPCMISTLVERASIEIGPGSGCSGTVIAATLSVKIGERVLCGANTTISDTDSHSLNYKERTPKFFMPGNIEFQETVHCAPVVIEDDVWLGMGVTVLKGVTIGARTVVGACSVVATSLPADVIAVGVPARPINNLAERLQRVPKF